MNEDVARTDRALTPGDVAPSFRLPSGQGPEVGLDDYRGRKNVVVWFTKGMGCAFCRHNMSRLSRIQADVQALGGEILEITVSTPARARLYAKKFALPFPYLSDPDDHVKRAYGLGARSHSLAWYLNTYRFARSLVPQIPPSDFGPATPIPLVEAPGVLADDDTGFFIVDREGIVRYADAGAYATEEGVRAVPSNEDILAQMQSLR